ncbi:hypothetical protein [Azotobacter beijerinckii]|uniref:Uncharacterized protein n=1 Tax=Azotobacter beijerinckii TaxID=170623 RepID=A0A1I4GGT7_9GAMM|nr:hypothetical protein [Azotobacter beijerinckii]SFB56568.1 hypothetical protein SAMN04244571_03857 [Azotobacter beijerinckii]SFL28401.1 hypothetical protein SAMN04244574_03804 [Azotobacter beijerinckii]
MEHKPPVERLWGIARTHSFAAFESCLHEACPDGSLKALTSTLRYLASASQHALAQELLSESLENHVASPQILWRLEMVLLLGHPGTGKDRGGVQDLATLENTVKELVLADRLDDAIERVSEAAKASAAPELYELLGRLYLRRSASQRAAKPALDAVQPEAATPAAQPLRAAVAPAGAARAEAQADTPPRPQEAAVRMEPRPLPEKAGQAAESPHAAAAAEVPAAKVETARPAAPSAVSASAGLAAARSGDSRPTAPTPSADTAEKAQGDTAAPPNWVAEELLKACARAQETMQKRAEAKADAAPVAKPAIIAIASSAPAAKPEPEPAPVEIPGPDEPKEQVFARLREAFTKLNKTERKLLAWVMANPNQNAAQIAKNTQLSSTDVATALKGLTGLWFDPFTFAGYTVRDYVMECMSMGKQAPTGASPSSRATGQTSIRSAEAPRTPSPAPRAAATAASAKPARPAATSPALSGLSGLDRQVLEYIRNHPGCSPDEVMDAMGPDEPASVSLVTLRREWLDRDAQGCYTIKPGMLDRISTGNQPEAPGQAAETEYDEIAETPRPSRPRMMERASASPLAGSPSAPTPPQKEEVQLAKLPKGQRQILQFLYDNGQARTKDIARTLDQDAAKVNSALLGPLAGFVSVMHSFWRLNDEIRPALAPTDELPEAAEA